MISDMQVLLVNPSAPGLPEGTAAMLSDLGCRVKVADDLAAAMALTQNGAVDAVILSEPPPGPHGALARAEFDSLLQQLDSRRIAALLFTDLPETTTSPGLPRRNGANGHNGATATIDRTADRAGESLLSRVRRDTGLAELRGRLSMIQRYHALLRRMEGELQNMERLGKRLNQHFRELDQEMRLAERLQRDFLPACDKPIGDLRFASIFRPASWVSGDTYDIIRVDEDHVAVYIADAVGHGMAAGLLTMFIKRAIVPKQVFGDHYRLLTPSEVMAGLNEALAEQSLPNCQFVTACYALINLRTLSLRMARGGHPAPLLISGGSQVSELKTSGGLLGLFKGASFPMVETQLSPGDKVLFYTDGVELAVDAADPDSQSYRRVFESLAGLDVGTMMTRLENLLDREAGSLHPHDDVTVVGVEVMRRD